jgi:ribonuclease P protein component
MRVGLIVPRFKHSAVARNRLKRQLRELARLRLLPAALSADVVLRIRPDAYLATFDALAADVTRAVVQLTRWRTTTATTSPEDMSPTSAPTSDA